jgi:hypothetical protein
MRDPPPVLELGTIPPSGLGHLFFERGPAATSGGRTAAAIDSAAMYLATCHLSGCSDSTEADQTHVRGAIRKMPTTWPQSRPRAPQCAGPRPRA